MNLQIEPSSITRPPRWRRPKGYLRAALLLGLLVAAVPAHAQSDTTNVPADSAETRTVARRMADEAANLYEAGRHEEARDLFHRANLLYPAPVLELWEARCLDKLGRLVEAEERYASVQRYKIKLEDTDVVRTAVREAGIELERLRVRVPTITLTLRGRLPTDPNLEIQLDGRRLNPALIGYPIPVNTGSRNVKLLVNGRERLRVALTLAEGDNKPIELDPDAISRDVSASAELKHKTTAEMASTQTPHAPLERPKPWYMNPTLGWVGLGLGSAGLVLGATAGLVASNKHSELSANCVPNSVCPLEYADELDSFRNYRTVSTIGYTLGGLALAGGATVLIFGSHHSRPPEQPRLALRLAGPKLSLVGRF